MNPWWPTPPVPLILLTVFSHSLYPCVVWESCLYHMETSNKLYNVPVYYVCVYHKHSYLKCKLRCPDLHFVH